MISLKCGRPSWKANTKGRSQLVRTRGWRKYYDEVYEKENMVYYQDGTEKDRRVKILEQVSNTESSWIFPRQMEALKEYISARSLGSTVITLMMKSPQYL